jgi:hypothetical protein
MADPCVADSIYIDLEVTGTPGVLSATLRNPEETYSGTQGDDDTHVVTDSDVVHSQTRTFVISNPGSAPARGIIVVALNPIWAGLPDDAGCSLLVNATLVIAGHPDLGDERDTITQPLAENEVVQFSLGSLVGQLDIPAGGSQSVTYTKSIVNDGASLQWSFRMGGDKLVAQMGY